MTRINKLKNIILMSLLVIGAIPSRFYESDVKLNLGLFYERATDLGHFVLYYVNAITFFFLMLFLHYPKGIDRILTRVLLIIVILDLLNLVLFSGQVFGGEIKLGIALVITYVYGIYKKYV